MGDVHFVRFMNLQHDSRELFSCDFILRGKIKCQRQKDDVKNGDLIEHKSPNSIFPIWILCKQEEISTKLNKISYKIEIINTELYKTAL